MKKLKENKGITLVALIITIIVLLILAVVAISAVQGDGIIAHAKNAKNSYQTEQNTENEMLTNYLLQLNNANNDETGETGENEEETSKIYTLTFKNYSDMSSEDFSNMPTSGVLAFETVNSKQLIYIEIDGNKLLFHDYSANDPYELSWSDATLSNWKSEGTKGVAPTISENVKILSYQELQTKSGGTLELPEAYYGISDSDMTKLNKVMTLTEVK